MDMDSRPLNERNNCLVENQYFINKNTKKG